MRTLVIGTGGREHALAWKLAAEPGVNEVLVAPGSDGIATEPRVRCEAVDPLDGAAVVAVARRFAAELVVVGPEAPLAAGVADALAAVHDQRVHVARPEARRDRESRLPAADYQHGRVAIRVRGRFFS